MREQQGQTAMDSSGFRLWTFDASPQPFEVGFRRQWRGKRAASTWKLHLPGHRDAGRLWSSLRCSWQTLPGAWVWPFGHWVLLQRFQQGQSKEGDTKVGVPAEQFIGRLSADLPRFYQLCCSSLTWAGDVRKCWWAWGANWGTCPIQLGCLDANHERIGL